MSSGDVSKTACRLIEVSIPTDGAERDRALVQLGTELSTLSPAGYAEAWVDHSPFPALCALVNGDRGWLMWIRFEGDAGFSSRNPTCSSPPDAEIEYMLSNGQMDRYPAAWAYSRSQVYDALQSFARTRRVAGISWFNDSEDGATSPSP